MSDSDASDKPVKQRPKTIGDCLVIVQHPAFRLGFLDARANRPIDHDLILARILAETPAGALKRLGWSLGPAGAGLFEAHPERQSVSLAQYRYEEGRILFLEHGVRAKAWGHPDFPPIGVRDFCIRWIKQNRETDDGS